MAVLFVLPARSSLFTTTELVLGLTALMRIFCSHIDSFPGSRLGYYIETSERWRYLLTHI